MNKYRKKPVVIEAIQWNGEEIIFNAPKWLSDSQYEGVIEFTPKMSLLLKH